MPVSRPSKGKPMQNTSRRWRNVARRLADAVPALLLAAMFLAFIVQVFMRYVLNHPVGWTVELCVIAWLWVVLWGQSVSAREEDEIRFDIIYGAVRPKVRRVFRILFSLFIVGIYAASLPDVLSYISFMKIEKTAYMKIPFSYVFSVFAIFTAVTILRYGWILIKELRGQGPEDDNPDLTHVARKDFSE